MRSKTRFPRRFRRMGHLFLKLAGWSALLLITIWAFGALWFDFPVVPRFTAGLFAASVVAAGIFLRPMRVRIMALGGLSAIVMIWWFSQQPSLDRKWQQDVAQLPWAEVNGGEITLHNIRNFDYLTETSYTPRWETRTVRLSEITGVDLFINYWGSPWMAHPIVSFQFANAPPLCFSIETRKEEGETYSAIGGLYRQYELIYIAADERDVVRLRTNFRQGEESFLYRTTLRPELSRQRFMEYVATINAMREHPRWYNAITTNCTTAIRSQHPAGSQIPWDWRILVNGKIDEMLFAKGSLVSAGLPFPALRTKALINRAAQSAGNSPDFSRLIRESSLPASTIP